MGLMIPSFAFAAYGLEDASKGTGLIKAGQTVSKESVPELIGTIVGVALSFVGAVFFLLILYAGFLWMTAFGDSAKVDKAKSILEHAAVGLLIVLAAYAISRFVFDTLAGGGSTGGSTPSFPTEATVNCPVIQEVVRCDNQYSETSVPLCRWVGEPVGGRCENNF